MEAIVPNVAEECYLRSKDFRTKAEQEKDPERRQELLETADEYAELIKLLKQD